MTVLLALYSSQGIIFAADSAITRAKETGKRERRPKQEKFFTVPKLGLTGGFVGFFGLARTRSGRDMSSWLRQTIDRWPGSRSAQDFAETLCAAAQTATSRADREAMASGFYVGTFEERDGVSVPVFWYVWNYDDIDGATGAYLRSGDYRVGEHFPRNHSDWNDVRPVEIRGRLREWERQQGIPFWLVNGELALATRTRDALTWAVNATVTQLPNYRLAERLEGWEELADVLVRTNGRLMKILRADAPSVEGPYRKRSLSWP